MHMSAIHTRQRMTLAFTVLEVLIAMGIFAVGFAAVAAIFPTAVLLQKQTIDDVVGQQVARNAQALLETRGLSVTALETATPTALPSTWRDNQRVHALPPSMLTGVSGSNRWLLADRSYPSTTHPVDARKMFWVPLVRDAVRDPAGAVAPGQVIVYVFILQREPDATYARPTSIAAANQANPNDSNAVPLVARITGVTVDASDLQKFDLGTNGNVWNGNFLINPGDQILDCFGGVHTVHSVNASSVKVSGIINPNLDTGAFPDEIWFAVPDDQGRLRPTKRILTLTSAVKP